jgi:hypothetical protein
MEGETPKPSAANHLFTVDNNQMKVNKEKAGPIFPHVRSQDIVLVQTGKA